MHYEEALALSRRDDRTLASAFLEQVKRAPNVAAVTDLEGSLSRIQLAGAAMALWSPLEIADQEERVGVLLPPGRGGALVNVALAVNGRTAVNLNHTAGAAALRRMCELAEVRTVVTARAYTDRIGWPEGLPVRRLDLEDVRPRVSKAQAVWHMMRIRMRSPRALVKGGPDDIACIVFSSGSTGDPKGVQLSHRQVLANVRGILEHLDLQRDDDTLLCPLPLFHSFGVSTGLWMPLTAGVKLAAHPDPTDARGIGELSKVTAPSFFASTPTFVRAYLRRIEPETWSTLRFGVVGAEKCPADLRREFTRRYGCELLEGYGCTELAPVVSVNRVDSLTPPGVPASRDGTAGTPLPGVAVLTMDPDTKEILPRGEPGLLVVRSPARMTGYLGRPDLTEAAFVHGGYNTGDMGFVDDEGFVHITGRLARFAKIGGEMIPMDLVEDRLLEELAHVAGEDHEHDLAVAAVPHRSKGEQLVILHTPMPTSLDDLVSRLDDLPRIFRPRATNAFEVEAIPTLGTGKRDLKGLQDLALALARPADRTRGTPASIQAGPS